MINRKNPAAETGYSSPFTLAVAAVAVCAALAMVTVAVRTPAAATSNVSTEGAAAQEGSFVYFPAQYENQATQIEPLPATF